MVAVTAGHVYGRHKTTTSCGAAFRVRTKLPEKASAARRGASCVWALPGIDELLGDLAKLDIEML